MSKLKNEPLTDEQKRLVRENVGLVSVHLRRFVRNLGVPRRDREWDDLFQEGCLGLIQAARIHRSDSGIPFAAFALPRIHNAVSRALQNKFSTVHIPPPRPPRASKNAPSALPEPQASACATVRRSCVGRSIELKEPDVRSTRAGALRATRRNDTARTSDEEHAETRGTRHDRASRHRSRDGSSPFDSQYEERRPDDNSHGATSAPRPRVHSLSEEVCRRLRDQRRHDPSELVCEGDVARETIGQRLRKKYERAVCDAGGELSSAVSRRGDRDELIHVLQEERFLIPGEESRRALRQIARDTKSSYARVAQCDKQLAEAIRIRLEADPEFVELRRFARESDQGCDLDIDDAIEHDLADAGAAAFVQRFRSADPTQRGAMLAALGGAGIDDFDDVLRHRVAGLPADRRERLLRTPPASREATAR